MSIFDISQLTEQNQWWIDKKNIEKDLKIQQLNKSAYKWSPNILHRIHLEKTDVIYSLRGPRQVGKTTLVKIIIKSLLAKKVKPENIFYWSFDRNNSKEMNEIIQTYLNWRLEEKEERKYLFFDEICTVPKWSNELIHFANKGDFQNCSILVTGSHSMDMKHSTELMPGRRGGGNDQALDKILTPMKFSEYVTLVWPEFQSKKFDYNVHKASEKQRMMFELIQGKIPKEIQDLMVHKKQLDNLFDQYLITGGIPAAINEYKKNDYISANLYNIYLSAIIGDLNRYGYKELFAKQILREIIKKTTSPVSWNEFTKKTEIKHHSTIQDYITAFEELYISNICYRASIHDKRIQPFYKKIYIQDPFMFHAIDGWANGKKDYFVNAKENILNLETKSQIVESVVHNHLIRFAYGLTPRDLFDPKDNIFYYRDKNDKEIDFLLKYDEEYLPFEVKYRKTVPNDSFIPFRPFKKGIIISKNDLETYNQYTKIPISIFLLLI